MSTTVLSTISKAPAAAPPAAETPAETAAPESTAAETPAVATEPVEVPDARSSEPEKPDPDLELSKKFDAVARREARARRHEAELQNKLTSFSEKEKKLDAMIAEYQTALEDPVEHALRKGKDPVEIAKRFARPMSEEEKRIAKLEERLEKDEKERERVRQENETREQTERRHAVMRRFVQGTDPKEYPHLTSVYDPQQISGLIHNLLNGPQDPTDPEGPTLLDAFKSRHGRTPTDKEIRDALEHQAETYAMSLIERLPKRAVPSQVTPETPPATEESTSLSNQHASSSTSTLKRTKSREEAMRELKAELEAEGGD